MMRALQARSLEGPDALELVELDEPPAEHPMSPGAGVLIDVHAAGVSFPDVLQLRGEYQFRAEPPYVPGGEVAGVVREAAGADGLAPGDRVAAMTFLGAFAEVAVAPPAFAFPLPDELDFAQGAALVMNYHTAWFALALRGRLEEGETVLVHGAAGGVGTAALQVARGLGARTIAVVSSDAKERVARAAGAEEVVRSTGPWREEAKELTGGRGVDVVFDPVGGDRFTDSLRALAVDGRALVVGFAEGSIPQVKVNRLLLNNVAVVGAGWGGYVLARPDAERRIARAVDGLVRAGAIRPLVGARFPLERGADALRLIDERGATGKVVLEVRASET
jgi:NADPH2:quinone reductase